jgi:hypothetical protein
MFSNHIGTFDNEKVKQGKGVYIWMGKASEEDETLVEKAKYDGTYKDGLKHGVGRMNFPNGDIFEGEWVDNKVCITIFLSFLLTLLVSLFSLR